MLNVAELKGRLWVQNPKLMNISGSGGLRGISGHIASIFGRARVERLLLHSAVTRSPALWLANPSENGRFC